MTVMMRFLVILCAVCVSVLAQDTTAKYSFLYTSSPRTYQSSCQAVLVPANTVAMKVVLFGGSGGRNRLGSQSRGGLGGGIAAVVPVVTGVNYFVCVAGKGNDGFSGGTIGYAGWPGGGYAQSGGGGGGFTSLQFSSDSSNYASRLVVAAGGGGGGKGSSSLNGANGGGVTGASAEGVYSQVSNSPAWCCTIGAKGGSQTAGGLGGGTYPSYTGRGSDGGLGFGGPAASSDGGGGGGGYYGGGGGAIAGGAGGSNWASPDSVLLWDAQGVTYTVYNFGGADVGGNGNATITFMSSYVFPSPTPAPSTAATPQPTSSTPTLLPTPIPTSPKPTASPTLLPSLLPTALPTVPPPSPAPSPFPSTKPTPMPSALPTVLPTALPTPIPSALPLKPSPSPTALSTSASPSPQPTVLPSALPSALPSLSPSALPTQAPSASPSLAPAPAPASVPAPAPTSAPASRAPSAAPTATPTATPTANAVLTPEPTTQKPSPQPSRAPSAKPTVQPTALPSPSPTALNSSPAQPSVQPSSATEEPSVSPTTAGATPFVGSVSLVLDGLTPDADATTRLALRKAVQVTLSLPDLSLVGEPVITAVPAPARAIGLGRRVLGSSSTKAQVEIQVTVPPSSPLNQGGNIPAVAESLRISSALSAPTTQAQGQGPPKPAFLVNFATSYASVAGGSTQAPTLSLVSVQVVADSTASPTIAPTSSAHSDSAGGGSSSTGGGAGSIWVIVGGACGAVAILACFYALVRRRKSSLASMAMNESNDDSSRRGTNKISFNATADDTFGRASGARGKHTSRPNPKQSVFVGYGDAYNKSQGDIFDEVPSPSLSFSSKASAQRSTYLSSANERL